MPAPVQHKTEKKPEIQKSEPPKPQKMQNQHKKSGFLDNLQSDDIILIVVILILLMDDCDDKLLLAALGIVFMTDIL